MVESLTTVRAEIDRIGKAVLEAQFPDCVRLPARRVSTGEDLGHLADNSGASVFHWDEDLSGIAKGAAANIFDFLRDYSDVASLYSATQKLAAYNQLDELLRDLDSAGATLHSAVRHTNIVGELWHDKAPMRMCIAYLVASKSDKGISDIIARKRFRLGV